MTSLSWLPRIVDRWGGMLLAPHATLDDVCRGQSGGLTDLLVLLGFKVLAVQLPQLVGALWFMVEVSYPAGISTFLNTIAESILVPVLAVFGGTVVTGWAMRGRAGRQRNLDLVALCMVPPVCFELLSTLIMVVVGFPPVPWVVLTIQAVEVIWFVALVVVSVRLVRRSPAESKEGEERSGEER